MELINLSKPEWSPPIFIGKALWIAMVLSMWTLFSCAYTSAKINKLNLECQAGNKHACAKLTAIARNDKNRDVRLGAVEKLTNQAALAYVAKNSKYSDVRYVALKMLTDQVLLADVARNGIHGDFRAAAVEKLADLETLANVARNDESGYVREVAGKRSKALKKNKH